MPTKANNNPELYNVSYTSYNENKQKTSKIKLVDYSSNKLHIDLHRHKTKCCLHQS